jgi:hypothetical protein
MSEQVEEFTPVVRSKRWDSVQAVYKEMETNQTGDKEYGLIWEGYISKVVGALGFHPSTGSQIMWDLKRMGCVEVLRGGSRGTLTQVKLMRPPTEELFNDYKDGQFAELTKQEQEAAKKQQLEFDTLARMDEFRETLETVIDELNKLADRVSADSKDLTELTKKVEYHIEGSDYWHGVED